MILTLLSLILPFLLRRLQRLSMEVSASSPEKNEELTLALKTWSRLEEETTGRFKGREGPGSGTGTGTGFSSSGSREGGDWMGIAERKMDSGSGSGMRRTGTGGGTAIEVDNLDDDNDGRYSFLSLFLFLFPSLFFLYLQANIISCLVYSSYHTSRTLVHCLLFTYNRVLCF